MPLCPAAGFGQNRKQEVTRYDHVCDVKMNYYNAQQRVGYYKMKFGPRNLFIFRTLQGEVMSVDALQIYIILPNELCATDAIWSPWELMRCYLILSHTKDIHQYEGIKLCDVDSRQIEGNWHCFLFTAL